MEVEALDKRTSKRGSKLFNIPDIEYSKQWQNWLTIQKIFTVLLFVYIAIRGDIFSILLAMFYLCYASLFSLHIPYSFFNISSIALYSLFFSSYSIEQLLLLVSLSSILLSLFNM